MKKLALIFIAISMVGCASTLTVTPPIAKGGVASFDGNVQNSGIIREGDAQEGGGVLVTPHFVARYRALIDTYGKRAQLTNTPILPGVTEATGKDKGNFWITQQVLSAALDMNGWRINDAHKPEGLLDKIKASL